MKNEKFTDGGLNTHTHTTWAQVVHYCSQRTVTCEEISGMRRGHGARGGRGGGGREGGEEEERGEREIKKE